jgi:hypothetical protein
MWCGDAAVAETCFMFFATATSFMFASRFIFSVAPLAPVAASAAHAACAAGGICRSRIHAAAALAHSRGAKICAAAALAHRHFAAYNAVKFFSCNPRSLRLNSTHTAQKNRAAQLDSMRRGIRKCRWFFAGNSGFFGQVFRRFFRLPVAVFSRRAFEMRLGFRGRFFKPPASLPVERSRPLHRSVAQKILANKFFS